MSRCLYSNVSKVPYHILLLVHVSEAAKMAALSHTSCPQDVPTTLQLGAIGARSLAYLTSRSHSHLDFFLLQHSISYLRIFKLEFYL